MQINSNIRAAYRMDCRMRHLFGQAPKRIPWKHAVQIHLEERDEPPGHAHSQRVQARIDVDDPPDRLRVFLKEGGEAVADVEPF